MTITPNLSLAYIDSGIPQPEVTHNDGVRVLDALVQLVVQDRDLATPPGSPADGRRWIVAASPTGAWSGHANHVLAWQDGAWRAYVPQIGWLAYVLDESVLLAWSGTAWLNINTVPTTLQNLLLLGLGTLADSTNPLSAKLNNTLWVAKSVAEGGDGNLRYKLSKESAAKTLSLLMQTNFSGRAELGLTGDDDFHLKVSADGSTWAEALTISRSTGGVRFLADETSVASAATCDIGSAASLKVQITGTTTITSLGNAAHAVKLLRFAGVLTLTHNASTLILPGGGNIVTAAGDTCLAVSDASGNWRVLAYQRASGKAPVAPAFSEVTGTASAAQLATTAAATLASAATTDLGSSDAQSITVSGTTPITSFGTTAPTGAVKTVTFSGALTLTHNATSLILPGAANIATQGGDSLIARHEGSGNWRVLSYTYVSGARRRLSADTTYYVRTDGSDSNTGAANTAGGAWLTLQKAYDWIVANIDLAGYTLTVQVGNGTYTAGISGLKPFTGGGTVYFKGDTTTPSNVIIQPSGGAAVFQATFIGVFYAIGGFKIVANAVSFGIYCSGLAQLTIQGKCEFNTVGGGTGVHIAAHGGFVLIVADYTISASASAHYKLWSKGLIEVVAVTITLTGTPAWGNAFAYCYGVSVLDVEAVPTFSGSATGTRYNVQWNGFIDTLGAGSTYLPGNSAGIAVNGGLYL